MEERMIEDAFEQLFSVGDRNELHAVHYPDDTDSFYGHLKVSAKHLWRSVVKADTGNLNQFCKLFGKEFKNTASLLYNNIPASHAPTLLAIMLLGHKPNDVMEFYYNKLQGLIKRERESNKS